MEQCAIFIDAGYLLAAGGDLCCGTRNRGEFRCNAKTFTEKLAQFAFEHCHLPVLRMYWYDGAHELHPTPEHLDIWRLPSVKVRLGRLVGTRQKGVDALIYRDLTALARERAMATAFLLSGDEDVREGVAAAQDMGVRVVLLGIPSRDKKPNQSEALIREADEYMVFDEPFWSLHFSPIIVPEAVCDPNAQLMTATKVGENFARQWSEKATQEEIKRLLDEHPHIPGDMDSQLLREAEQLLGRLWERQDLKKILRAAFWNVLGEILVE